MYCYIYIYIYTYIHMCVQNPIVVSCPGDQAPLPGSPKRRPPSAKPRRTYYYYYYYYCYYYYYYYYYYYCDYYYYHYYHYYYYYRQRSHAGLVLKPTAVATWVGRETIRVTFLFRDQSLVDSIFSFLVGFLCIFCSSFFCRSGFRSFSGF